MSACSFARRLMLIFAAPFLLNCGGGGSGGSGGASNQNEPVPTSSASSDTMAPQATLFAPANLAAELTGALVLSAIASDNIAVTRVESRSMALAQARTTPRPLLPASIRLTMPPASMLFAPARRMPRATCQPGRQRR